MQRGQAVGQGPAGECDLLHVRAGAQHARSFAVGHRLVQDVQRGMAGFHQRLEQTTQQLMDGLQRAAAAAGVGFVTNHVCGMFGLFFTTQPAVRSFAEVMACDGARFNKFFHAMLDAGVYLAPSAYEAGFVSAAHGAEEITATVAAAARVFKSLV